MGKDISSHEYWLNATRSGLIKIIKETECVDEDSGIPELMGCILQIRSIASKILDDMANDE